MGSVPLPLAALAAQRGATVAVIRAGAFAGELVVRVPAGQLFGRAFTFGPASARAAWQFLRRPGSVVASLGSVAQEVARG